MLCTHFYITFYDERHHLCWVMTVSKLLLWCNFEASPILGASIRFSKNKSNFSLYVSIDTVRLLRSLGRLLNVIGPLTKKLWALTKIIPFLWGTSSSKKSKTYIRRPQIKKFYKTEPTKIGNSDSKYNFKIFKTKSQTQKDPLKQGILIQNSISQFKKLKIKLKKDPLKFQKIKNIYKEASNQKVL